MNLYKSLLFLHGHVADQALARSLADTADTAAVDATTVDNATAEDAATDGTSLARSSTVAATTPFVRPRRTTPGFFGSLWYLGGLDDIDPRIGENGEAYAPKYGRRRESSRRFAAASPVADTCLAGCH